MTRFEKQCERIAKGFRPLTESQRRYATKHGPAFIMLYRNRRYCSECGEELEGDRCRNCGADHRESDEYRAMKRHHTLLYYFRIESSAGDTEYKRTFRVLKTAGMGEEPEHIMLEVTRNFLDEKGRKAVQAVEASSMGWRYDNWIQESEMRTRPNTGTYAYMTRNFGLYAEAVWPHGRPAQWLRKRGYTKPERGYDRTWWQVKLTEEPFAEWLQKKGLTWTLENETYERLKKNRRELELCEKHGYRIGDIQEWCDLVEENRELGRDTLNAKWSRPEDFDKAREETGKAIRRKHERERQERERAERQRDTERIKEYESGRLRWAGIAISGEGITITPLTTAEELAEEGKAMHHCVAGYWRNTESLVLSARDGDGKRLATIEWNTKTRKTVQCRGVCNGTPEKKDLILSLMERGRRKLAAAMR